MREHWPAVKETFEALSYILKPMAPNGIELFYTVSYETWLRHDTKELVNKLEGKGVAGDTNISYRLQLQLDMYKAKIPPTPRKGSSKSKKFRPMCFYILTDGTWRAKGDPTAVIKGMADSLITADLKGGQVTIQFISFGQNAAGLQRMKELAETDFGLYVLAPSLVCAFYYKDIHADILNPLGILWIRHLRRKMYSRCCLVFSTRVYFRRVAPRRTHCQPFPLRKG
jgi:hypothetical protein